MTYTGHPRINVARDLPAAIHPSIDIWIRTPTGAEAVVLSATWTGDIVEVTVQHWNWPRPNMDQTFTLNADDRIDTRIY
jgi:hypothetical protein